MIVFFICLTLIQVAVPGSLADVDGDDSVICTAQCYTQCRKKSQASLAACQSELDNPSCQCHHNESGFIPPLPKLDILKKVPLTIGWPNNGDVFVCPFCVFVLQRRFNSSLDAKWTTVTVTPEVQYVSDDLSNDCRPQWFRLAAVSIYGSHGFSNMLPVQAPSVPGPVYNLHWASAITYKEDTRDANSAYFEANLTWGLPNGWSEKEIKKYESNYAVIKHSPGSRPATPLIEFVNNLLTVKLFHTTYGMIYEIQVVAVSYCSVKGEMAKIRMDLTDCRDIQHYPCPTTPAPKPVLSGSPEVSQDLDNPATFLISWHSDSPNVASYALQWGTYSFLFMLDRVINETLLPATTTSVKVDLDICFEKKCGIRIVPLADGQAPPSVFTWGLYTIYPFNAQAPSELKPDPAQVGQANIPDPPRSSHLPTVTNQTTTPDGVNATSSSPTLEDVTGIPFTERMPMNDDKSSTTLVMATVIPICALLVILAVIVVTVSYIKHKRAKKKQKPNISTFNNNFNYYKSVIANEKNPLYPQCSLIDDEFEVPIECLVFGDVLGQGAFGTVKQASLLPSKWVATETIVAVKMMLEHATDNQKQEFLQEIGIMRKLGKHPHIVSMLGYGSITEPLFVVVEHMCNGDLVHYLRCHRGPFSDDDFDGRARLTHQDLLSFARQICIGMEFLSQKGYVHRDLAARNVLVGENKIIKIGDFGLTRYIYDDKVYINRKGGKLPLKWMSIEAISDLAFSSASDVWSFGVLLFELVTLGGTPYPTISNHELLRDLKAGYRMERPESCSKQLYGLMLECWAYQPGLRPTFTKLRNIFDQLLEACCPDDYVDLSLDVDKDYYRMRGSSESIESSESVWNEVVERSEESEDAELVPMDTEDLDQHCVVDVVTRL